MFLRYISNDFSKNISKNISFVIFALLIVGIILFPITMFAILNISHQSGFYDEVIQVTISSSTGGEIYYTLDGSLPQSGSFNTFIYTSPIFVQQSTDNKLMFIPTAPEWEAPQEQFKKATVLRVIEIFQGHVTDEQVRTYFIGITHALPIISIIIEPENFFDKDKGIYVPGKLFNPSNPYWSGNYHQRGAEWERPAIIEYFEDNQLKYRTEVGIRIHGEFSRSFPIKSLRLYARNKEKEFTYPFFGRTGYKKLLLRNAGNDYEYAYMRDAVIQNIFKGLNFDTQDNYPVIHYINGEYWGIIYLMEYYDQRYLQVKYGVNEKNTVIINYDLTIQDGKEGEQASFIELLEFVKTHDLSIKENYEKVCEMIDIENFINFKICEILAANNDWPGNNERMWRVLKKENTPLGDGKWRWMMYDMDNSFWIPDHDTLKVALHGDPDVPWTMKDEATLLLRKLMDNE
ncbi:MAG: CotH kinase family protein, partial [Fervidobacterium sp.]